MLPRELAVQLVRNALFLEDLQRKNILELLEVPEVSDVFIKQVINILQRDQSEFETILASLSDEEVTRLGITVMETKADEVRNLAGQDATESTFAAEDLLNSTT